MEEKIKKVIAEKIVPMLQTHNGACEFVALKPNNVVEVRLQGACKGCPGSLLTLKGFVLATLQEDIPEITDVIAVQ